MKFIKTIFTAIKRNFFIQKLVSGTLSGVNASILTYPFDLVKTYLTINVYNGNRLSM